MEIKSWITCSIIGLSSSLGYAQDHIVKMVSTDADGPVFEPNYLRIQPGDVVIWVNVDSDVQHNIVADPTGIPKESPLFESPLLDASDKWSYRFEQAGTYNYHCHPHFEERMRGRIVVGRESLPDELRTDTGSSHMHHHEGGHN